MRGDYLPTLPATAQAGLVDYPPVISLGEAQQQIKQLKLELADKQRELELYLHVAARASEAAEQSSSSSLAAEVRDLRDRLLHPMQLPPPVGYQQMPPQPPPPPPQSRQTPLQCTLSEINYAFDLLDERGAGTIGRWELLRGMMDTPEVRGLLRLSTVANQSEFDVITKAMGGADSDLLTGVSRHEFECYFLARELERHGMGGGTAAKADAAAGKGGKADAAGGKADAAGGKKAAEGGKGAADAPPANRGQTGAPTPGYTNNAGYVVPGYTPGAPPGYAPGYAPGPPPYARPDYHSGYGYGAMPPEYAWGGYGSPMYGGRAAAGHMALNKGMVRARPGPGYGGMSPGW